MHLVGKRCSDNDVAIDQLIVADVAMMTEQ